MKGIGACLLMNIWRSGVLFVVFLGFLAYGSRLLRRTTDGDPAFWPSGLRGMFWDVILFLWLRIPVMGAVNFFASSRMGVGILGLKTTKSAHLIFGYSNKIDAVT